MLQPYCLMNMKKIKIYILSLLGLLPLITFSQVKQADALIVAQETRKNYINFENQQANKISKSLYVNPFIGTGGHGHTYPGASLPFGMMQLSPDTRYEGWDGCSGYHYSDSIIYGFSHTHLSGTGVPDYCDLLFVPQSGKPKINPGYLEKNGYGSKFHHAQERASPGFYEVYLEDEEINVRLTVSERSGMHEYTFLGDSKDKYILIDLDHRDKLLNSDFEIIDDNTIRGSRISEAWAKEQHFYFYLSTSIPFENSKIINDKGRHKLLLKFPSNTSTLLIKVGMSSVDKAGAQKNLEAEIPDWEFNDLRANASRKWNDELNKIDYQASEEDKITFYTALYHSFLNPNIFSDIDGQYRGRDNEIHKLEGDSKQYTVFSLWDTYRATHPLFTIVQQKRTTEFVNTFMSQYFLGFDLPVWELAANETDCMIGYHSVSVIADAFIKGINGYNAEDALKAMVFTSKINELGKQFFRKNGFISSGDEPESVSKTLEYAYDDFCIAEMARYMGKMDVYQEYYNSCFNFINLYDPSTKFMRARRGGLWIQPFDPSEVNFNYTEANSWQYSLYAPHAIDVLSELIGGKDSLELWLDRLFTTNMELSGRHQVDITGLIGQYAHGNEPSHHMAYLYNFTNTPHKTQFYVDKILKEMYKNTPDGLSGNEDCGQMSSWYVLSALGIYQITPGHAWYEFGRPMMDEATINLESDKKLIIKTVNNSHENKYIQSITWNGKIWEMNQIHHSTIIEGGELVFTMGPKPSHEKRSISNGAIDKNMMLSFAFTPSPFFLNSNSIFEDSMSVSIGHHQSFFKEKVAIEYRFSEDTTRIFNYTLPFTINESTSIEARRVNYIGTQVDYGMPSTTINKSPWVKADYFKRNPNVQLLLETPFDNQYAAGGQNALIDGVRGGNEFRTGDWQGYNGKNIIAEISFDNPMLVGEIGLSCLMDMKSWIFLPSQINMSYSVDGEKFIQLDPIVTNYKLASNVQSPTLIPSFSTYVGSENYEFYRTLENKTLVKKIRIEAINFGKCPEWHLGNGNDTWLFTDEIIFR